MITCSGVGGGGDHCCWIDGEECEYLVRTPLPRCSLLLELGTWNKVHKDTRWKRSSAGKWFKKFHPGYGCGDWPQKIDPPPVGGWCCFEKLNPRNVVTVPLPGG